MLVIAQPECIHFIKDFKLKLNSRYGIKDLGEAISFLNITILRNTRDKKLWISQHGYIEKICTKFGIDDSGRTATTPLLSSYRPQQYEGQATLHQITEMQEKVGSILYAAVVSRPDVSFAASQLSQFTMNPSPEHLRYANRVLAYLQATKYYAIEFLGSVETTTEVETRDEEVLQLSSDASFADDPETRRSTQGYLMKLFKGPIMWQSSKQKTVTTSTTEAELLSLSHTAKETIGLYRLFEQIQFDPEHLPRILCDNQQTTGLIQKDRPQASSKLKHVDIHSLWLRQVYRDGIVTVQWVPTTEMPSDGFTKPLSAEKHSQFQYALFTECLEASNNDLPAAARVKILRPIKPVVTRWNSYYSALERATYLKGGFDLYIEKHVSRVAYEERRGTQSDAPAWMRSGGLQAADWAVVTEYQRCLEPLKITTKRLEGRGKHHGSSFGAIHEVLPVFEYLLDQLEKLAEPYADVVFDAHEEAPEDHLHINLRNAWVKAEEYYQLMGA
ncbi:hypothetical protein PTT_11852 [Pyrenophora teres f. teres 0-1]|uniref:Reverse transcriptase Ty1/copia-type domain-containing protein n=1 Tax=Pyrenophora teres f. teres (strain 0-1) TaxID=861557 RepID=E3RSG5_PYRTT|nr:hypothetical protein PTT_11852 [Pyrenophora teres f. teres 0-1]